MREAAMGALRDFVSEVLEMEGSAVEAVEPDGLEVLAPGPLRTVMGWPELVRLGFGAELPAGATVRASRTPAAYPRTRTPAGSRHRISQRRLALARGLGGLDALPAACFP